MNQVVLQSLQQISTGYSVFEKDQVLTHSQLNTVAEYFDDQTRLSRTKLLGVGIVCGLRASTDGDNVTVSKGAGITTEGDLLYLPSDTVFEQYKLYDESNPTYSLFAPAISAKKIYEWRPKLSAKEELGTPLAKVKASQTIPPSQVIGGSPPKNNMVAVLFMEEYVKDEDICTGTDCDNLGQNLVSSIKLLLLDKSVLGSLKETIPTPDQAARALKDIVADRPLFSSTANSPAKIAAIYGTACKTIHQKLALELPKLYPTCGTFLGDTFASDPASGWMTRLNGLATTFSTNPSGIQYYYDFLKDLVETYNDFRQLLFGDSTLCCPDMDTFPKHLLLGNVVAGADPEANRTGFYPSCLASHTTDQLKHARFLAAKLGTLINTFKLPPSTGLIRITPSRFGEVHLDERAIPFYYEVNSANPIQKQWSYRLHQQGMDAWNYSYNAASYSAQGGAANPLKSQLGRFGLFRIEGHLGMLVATAKAAIEAEIKNSNLPFVVQSVLLGTDRTKVVIEPGIHYTPLHDFHQILRNDLVRQLDETKTFSAYYAGVANKPANRTLTSAPQKAIANNSNSAISKGVSAAKSILKQSYSQYKSNASAWKPSVEETLRTAAEFKEGLGDVTKTAFTTPFDSFIANGHAQWLDWLDVIIQHNDDAEVEKLLYSNFQALHPGLEHFAGVVPGGTFVLVYNTSNQVVGDFMLPYYYFKAAPEVKPHEPVLPVPPPKPPVLIRGSITLGQGMETYVSGQLDTFTHTVLDPKLLGTIATLPSTTATAKVAHSALDATVGETRAKPAKTKQPKAKAKKNK